jgi:predicted metal-dependent hydrolase
MNTNSHQISVSGIDVTVVRKKIKNLHLAVYPPNGRVRIAVPLHVNDEAVRLAVISKLGWIRKKQKAFEGQIRQSQREMVSGESIYFKGRRLRLRVIETSGRPDIRLQQKTVLQLYILQETTREKREQILNDWYRAEMKELLPELILKWEPILDVSVADWGVKRMKTRWGSCNPNAKRIWLNLELIKKPIQCLEYVLVHEMVHLLEPSHNDRFKGLMDQFYPAWRSSRDELNKAPLAHEDWTL